VVNVVNDPFREEKDTIAEAQAAAGKKS